MKILAKYITGSNHAHCSNNVYKKRVFKCPMYGTFNVKLLTDFDITKYNYAYACQRTKYWLVKIRKENAKESYYGWVVKWDKSGMSKNTLEIISKRLLPDFLKEGIIEICEVCEKWSDQTRDNWAKNIYWWQTFDWSPKKRADSKMLWDSINIINWSGLSVLDIGSHYGYMSFKASKEGALVTGVEKNQTAVDKSKIINDHIEMCDVEFYKPIIKMDNYDVILDLSVYHQIDPDYKHLYSHVEGLKKIVNKCLFIELIMPPMFGKDYKEVDIDKIVGGKILKRYQHKVRGIRKIYFWEKK